MTFNKKILLWLIKFLFCINGVLSLNILGVFPYTGKSHFFVFKPYLLELAKRGHNLTVISYFPQQQPNENYHDITLPGETLGDYEIVYGTYWSILESFIILNEMGRDSCEVMLSSEPVQNLWKSEIKFDLVVTERFNSDCSLGLAYKLDAPVVGMTSTVPMPWHYEQFGVPFHPAHMAFQSLEGGTKPNLYQRIERVIFHNICNILYKYTCQRVNQQQLQQYFDVPPLEDLARDVKIVLLYTHFVISGLTLLPPNVKEVGGYHVAKPKELPKDLRKFIEESENGVIYISFGTTLQASSIPKPKLEAIVGAISDLPQRVVWKWDSKVLPGNPKNVYLSDWLPQNDILAHSKVLAFYSHCGMLSTTEAIHHGVPMIGMPVLADQPLNADAIKESGLGVTIQIHELTKEILLQKIKTVLAPEFRRKVKDLSKIWHDRAETAMNSAIYWTEYTARNKNFTFRSPMHSVPTYQYFYLDFIIVAICTLSVAFFVVNRIFSFISRTRHQKPMKIKTK